MLRSVRDLEAYAVGATDGETGHVKDFYFDDRAWVVRYLVVDAGTWLSSRQVLISPISIGRPDPAERSLHVWLTKDQVKNSPLVDTDKPVYRQHGAPLIRVERGNDRALPDIDRNNCIDDDPHICSCRELMTYDIHATDGDIGRVDDVLIDDQGWAIRYLVVGIGHGSGSHRSLVAWQWIEQVSWSDAAVGLKMNRQAIENAPPYESIAQLEHGAEARLHDHYGERGYWADESMLKAETRV